MFHDRFRRWLFLTGAVLFVMALSCKADDKAPPPPLTELAEKAADFKPTAPTDLPVVPAVPPPPAVNPSPQAPVKPTEADPVTKPGIPAPLPPISVVGGAVPVTTTHGKRPIETALDHLGQRLGNSASWLVWRHGLKAHAAGGFVATGPASSAMFAASSYNGNATILHVGSTSSQTTTTTTTNSVAHQYAIAPGAGVPAAPQDEPREAMPSPQSQSAPMRAWGFLRR